MAAAEEIAEKILECGPLSVQAVKELARRALPVPLREAVEMNYGRVFLESEDYREGQRAFVEKRKPVWKNR